MKMFYLISDCYGTSFSVFESKSVMERPGVNFTNVLRKSFTLWRSQKHQKDSQVKQLFSISGSALVKDARKHVDEINLRLLLRHNAEEKIPKHGYVRNLFQHYSKSPNQVWSGYKWRHAHISKSSPKSSVSQPFFIRGILSSYMKNLAAPLATIYQ